MPGFFFGKVAGQAKTPAQVFSYEFCDIFKNTYFIEHLRTAASGILNFIRFCFTSFIYE